jgi:hypothetical protein
MPDTGAYLILGLAAVTLIVGLLIVSMIVRQRNLDRDLDLIEQLRDETP